KRTVENYLKNEEQYFSQSNYVKQRELLKSSYSTLPFLGMCTKDLTMAFENTQLIHQYETLGKVFAYIKQATKNVYEKPLAEVSFQTDLPVKINIFKLVKNHSKLFSSLSAEIRAKDESPMIKEKTSITTPI